METKKSASAKVSTNDRSKQQLSLIEKLKITLKGDEPVLVRLSKFLNPKIKVITDKLIGATSPFVVVGKPQLYIRVDEETGDENPHYIINLKVIRYGMGKQFRELVEAFAETQEITRGDETKVVSMIDVRVLNDCLLTYNKYPNKDGSFDRLPSPGMVVEASVTESFDEFTGETRVGVSHIVLPEAVEADELSFDLDAINADLGIEVAVEEEEA